MEKYKFQVRKIESENSDFYRQNSQQKETIVTFTTKKHHFNFLESLEWKNYAAGDKKF